jgi:hypothetical protein
MISRMMFLTYSLEVALEREVEGDLFLQDIGQGFGFRPGSFDGAIRCEIIHHLTPARTLPSLSLKKKTFPHPRAASISVLQWLLNAETSHPTSSPPHRLTRFFTTLHSALRNPSRAVLQFYPSSDDQIQLITSIAQRAGFGGGIVVDYPNSKKARKVFLCLFVGDGGGGAGGEGAGAQVPEGLQGDEESEDAKVKFERRRQRESRREKSGKQKAVVKGGRDWVLRKKDVRVFSLLKSAFSSSLTELPFQISAVPETRKGGRSSRLEVYRSQKKANFLKFLAGVITVPYCTLSTVPLPAHQKNEMNCHFFVLLSCGQKLSR